MSTNKEDGTTEQMEATGQDTRADDKLPKGGEQRHTDAKMDPAQTQTQKHQGTDKGTQTTVVSHHRATQTEEEEKAQRGPQTGSDEPTLQDNSAPTPPGPNEQPEKEQNPERNKESQSSAPTEPAPRAATRASYAQAASPQQPPADQSGVRVADAERVRVHSRRSPVATFTFHIYAVLDKRFGFKPQQDQLVAIIGDDERFPLQIQRFG